MKVDLCSLGGADPDQLRTSEDLANSVGSTDRTY